jgi:D-alanine-D-alanine ligase
MANYTVGVIFGSRSPEHEVSIVSALQVMDFLSKRHQVIPIYITKEGKWLTGEKLLNAATYKSLDLKDPDLKPVIISPDPSFKVLKNPLGKGLLSKPEELKLDIAFPVIHGLHGEDGTLQGLLELANLPYVGSDQIASAVCIDKVITKLVLAGTGIPVLDWVWFTRLEWEANEDAVVQKIEQKLAYPVIIKPARLGSSIGISIARDQDELRFNVSVASHFDTKLLVEPCLQEKMEVNCAVLGFEDPKPSVCEQPLTGGAILSFEDKYLQGSRTQGMEAAKRIIPAPIGEDLTRKIQELAVQAFKAVGARGIARIDFMIELPGQTVYINEINTLPGSIAYYLWQPLGMTPQQLVDELLEEGMRAHKEKNRSQFSAGPALLGNIDLLHLRKD